MYVLKCWNPRVRGRRTNESFGVGLHHTLYRKCHVGTCKNIRICRSHCKYNGRIRTQSYFFLANSIYDAYIVAPEEFRSYTPTSVSADSSDLSFSRGALNNTRAIAVFPVRTLFFFFHIDLRVFVARANLSHHLSQRQRVSHTPYNSLIAPCFYDYILSSFVSTACMRVCYSQFFTGLNYSYLFFIPPA